MAYTSPFTINSVNDYLKSKLSPTTTTTAPAPTGFVGPVQSPTPTPTPSSPSATTTVKPTTTTPAPTPTPYTANIYNNGLNPSLKSPAAQTYISNQVPSTPPPAPATTSAPSSTPAPSSFYGSPTSNSAPQSAYFDFLSKQFNEKDLDRAFKDKQEFEKRTSEELLRTRKEEDRIRKNEKGQLESGQSFDLNEEARKSNRSLADLALAKGYAVETYNNMISAGKSLYEAQTAAQKDFEARSAKILEETAPALTAQLKSLPDKISQDNFIRQKASELGVSIDQLNSALQKELQPELKDLPASIQEYEYAKAQGYKGTYQQWVDRKGTGSSGSTLKADINADVSGILNKWQGLFGQDGKISPENYRSEKSSWIRAYAGDVADPSKQFDDLFSSYANQSYYGWEKDYGIK